MISSKNSFDQIHWILLDIETTGLNPLSDSIIDVGFLEYRGTRLVKRFSSLVYYEGKLSHFISSLTGISAKALITAPRFSEVQEELRQLMEEETCYLLAHNAEFEKSYLAEKTFPKDKMIFVDSIPLLALMFPFRSHLSLESFLIEMGIKDKEDHRGLADSEDLLRVLLLSLYHLHQDRLEDLYLLRNLFAEKRMEETFWFKLLELPRESLLVLAKTIDFDLEISLQQFHQKSNKEETSSYKSGLSFQERPALNFSGDNMRAIFQNNHLMKKVFEHYQYRSSQEALALRVGQAFKNKVHSIIQAPTGTGKTLGYLLPSAIFSLSEDKKILVATGTKTLQQQAMEKDIPHLKQLLGLADEDLKTARLVGSANHLCELLFHRQKEDGALALSLISQEERFAALYFELIFQMHERAEKSMTRDDIPYTLKMNNSALKKIDDEIKVDFRTCVGHKCAYKHRCSYMKDLKAAKEASIIIGNHALMLTWPKSIPRPEYIIVDEAHRIEHEATEALSFHVKQEALESMLHNLQQSTGMGALYYLLSKLVNTNNSVNTDTEYPRQVAMQAAESLVELLRGFPEFIESYFKLHPSYTSLYWNELPMPSRDGIVDNQATGIFNIFEKIRDQITEVFKVFFPYLSFWDKKELDDLSLQAYVRFETFMVSVEDLLTALNHVVEHTTGFQHSLFYHESYGFAATASPIDIGRFFYDQVIAPSQSVVMTSATIGNMSGTAGTSGMEWALGHKYIETKKRFKSALFLPPVFDYNQNSLVYLCDDIPDFKETRFVPHIMDHLVPLLKKLGGRSLLLFSAKLRFEEAREHLLMKLEGEIPLFIQGMGNNVVEEYKKAKNGILLGMESFGEGIDIPGEGLQFVFIDKIPDIRMELVIKKRREFYDQNFGNEFQDYFMASRMRGLQQKLGRLLRRDSDYGGAIIVDARIKKWQGKTIHALKEMALPYDLRTDSFKNACDEVARFIMR